MQLNTVTWAKVQLDKDKYDADVAAALGFVLTVPPATADVYSLGTKALLKTGKVARARATMFNGTGEAIKTRVVEFLCDIEKVGKASGALVGKTATLGNGLAAKPWKFGDVRIG